MKARTISLDETAVALFTVPITLAGVFTVHNPNATTAYVKIWERTAAPTVASDAATILLACPFGNSTHVLFSNVGVSWIAATTESGAGDTAPTVDLIATYTSEPV